MKSIKLLFLFLLLTSCLGSKKIITTKEKTTKEKTTEVKKDSSTVTRINKAVSDDAILKIGKSGNRDCDQRYKELLSKINLSKRSGGNSYKLYYDAKLEALRLQIELEKTQDRDRVTNTEKETTEFTEKEFTEKTKKIIRILPWWAWLVIAWLLRSQIISIISIFVPGVKQIKTIKDLFTPPNIKRDD